MNKYIKSILAMLCYISISCESKIEHQNINSDLDTIFLVSDSSSQDELHSESLLKGYFIDLEEQSHHTPGEAKFQKLDSTYISLLILNDKFNKENLESVSGKLLEIYYSIDKSYIQEFKDTLILKILDSVKVIN